MRCRSIPRRNPGVMFAPRPAPSPATPAPKKNPRLAPPGLPHRPQPRTRKNPRGWPALDRDRPQVVVADQRGRPDRNARLREAAQRDHLAFSVPTVNAIDVVNTCPVLVCGLSLALPGPAKKIDIIDEITAERGLQGLKDVV